MIARPQADRFVGIAPFLAVLAAWYAIPKLIDYPPYMLPSLSQTWDTAWEAAADGTLAANIAGSLARLAIGFVVGTALAIPLGIAIALNRHVADTMRPLLTFLQSIAGIAWVPLAIIWFGIGMGSVVFVIANTIFFASIYNTVIGVELIPNVLHRAVRSLGASRAQMIRELIVPGALVQIILGLRTAMAYGWRALVAGEMIAGTSGLGYMTIEAVQWYKTDTIILGMIVIGILWLILDRVLFVPLERRTVARWGLVRS